MGVPIPGQVTFIPFSVTGSAQFGLQLPSKTGLLPRYQEPERARGFTELFSSRAGDLWNWHSYAAQLNTHEPREGAVPIACRDAADGAREPVPVVHAELMQDYLVDTWGFSEAPRFSYSWALAVDTLTDKLHRGMAYGQQVRWASNAMAIA